MEHCICGALRGKTRVLVTHQVALTLPRADYVIIMDKGAIVEQGSRAELQDRAAALLERYGVGEGGEEEGTEGGASGHEQKDTDKAGEKQGGTKEQEDGDDRQRQQREGTRLIREEEREEGRLKLRVYFRAMGGLVVALFLLGQYGAVEGLRYEQTRLLGTWVERITAGHDVTTSGLPYIYVSPRLLWLSRNQAVDVSSPARVVSVSLVGERGRDGADPAACADGCMGQSACVPAHPQGHGGTRHQSSHRVVRSDTRGQGAEQVLQRYRGESDGSSEVAMWIFSIRAGAVVYVLSATIYPSGCDSICGVRRCVGRRLTRT